MTLTHHSISFTPHPTTSNTILARCSCGWERIGPSLEVQSAAACHDLDLPDETADIDWDAIAEKRLGQS